MELIIDFYKSLDTLNLIIFWGIIVVIILLLIFSAIMINKNRRLKKIVEKNNKYEEDIPIKKEEPVLVTNIEEDISKQAENKEDLPSQETSDNSIKEEKQFVAEEHVISYHQDQKQNINLQNNYIEKQINNEQKKQIEMPTGPYQRNVLREMSLSQTSPIGINRQTRNEEKKVEMVKDLENSLNNERLDNISLKEDDSKTKYSQSKTEELNSQIKKELSDIEKILPRKTEINRVDSSKSIHKNDGIKLQQNELKGVYQIEIQNKIDSVSKELLNINSSSRTEKKDKSPSEKYLEEVSRKLAEAEIPDEIERTNYELQQEEEAIISYKELMEKKDSIQTIDEEEAIISIEELMNRNNKKQNEAIKDEDTKLYNLTESEENDDFIKELKQFRNDL